MATAADVTRRIDTDLRVLSAEIASLPEMAASRGDEPDVNRDVYYLEWRNLMAILATLDGDYRSGTMTPDQRARYRKLLDNLRDNLSSLEQLDLPLPTVPLADAPSTDHG